MATKTKYKNANGVDAEITLINPDTNIASKEIDISKLLEENGISGSFTTTDGKTITIVNGLVTGIEV